MLTLARQTTFIFLFPLGALLAADPLPKVLDERLQLELFAENPQIATPTGIDVDHRGRVWAIESNTHFRPKDYPGHPTDRVLVFEDRDETGRARKVTTFADGFTHAMSVVVKPAWVHPTLLGPELTKETTAKSIFVFIATRNEILLCIDRDGDLKCDERKRLIYLDTPGNYPHNGLAGITFDDVGQLYFGFGENLGANYKISGTDGETLKGGGEGGNFYRCFPNGAHLEQIATGFWNPHASCVDAQGRIFTVDNDPDSRPPCRLLHIVRGGDYGYRFRNGRRGTHPFTAWNGEIPGTLPMVAGTGEAPSGIVAYESDGFPQDYQGTLLVGTWGDHRIDRFTLKPNGASVTSVADPIVKGGENFRPVGLALAPDGSLYFTDWVKRDYNLHGQGRIWRLVAKQPPQGPVIDAGTFNEQTPMVELQKLKTSRRMDLRRTAETWMVQPTMHMVWAQLSDFERQAALNQPKDLIANITSNDPFRFHQAVYSLSHPGNKVLRKRWESGIAPLRADTWTIPEVRLAVLLELRRQQEREAPTDREFSPPLLTIGLKDPSPLVLRAVVQWIGEDRQTSFAPQVQALLEAPQTTPELFLACLATLSLLDGVPAAEFEKTPPAERLLKLLADVNRSDAFRIQALRLIPADAPGLSVEQLRLWSNSEDAGLRQEALRTLQLMSHPVAQEALRAIAVSPRFTATQRAEALAGLARGPNDGPLSALNWETLAPFLQPDPAAPNSPDRELWQREVIRTLRSRAGETPVRLALIDLRNRLKPSQTTLRQAIDFVLREQPATPPSESELEALAQSTGTIGDIEAGRRLFFHVNGPLCGRCHTVQGRGGKVGPDLSAIARTMNRAKLVESITSPSREVSPQYTTWNIETKAGKVVSGIILTENGGGDLQLGDEKGDVIAIKRGDIEDRTPATKSIMPDNLHQQMTPQDLRDLLAFLETLK